MRSLEDSPVRRDGRSIVLAHDHGLEHGPSQFEAVPERLDPAVVFDVATHDAVTALAVGKGLAETYYPSYADDVTLLAKLNGTSSLWSGEPYSPRNWSVDRAADLGAAAVGYTVYPGSNREPEMFEDFRDVQAASRDHDLPVTMWAYPRGQAVKDHRTPEIVAYAARIALELGADVAKVKYPRSAEGVARAVRAAGPLPLLLSGGSRDDDRAFYETVRAALDAGVEGLAVGRNVWQAEDPVARLDALEALVFEDASVEAVLD